MPRCTRKGCNQDFDKENNVPDSCRFHPGAPVFHEGLKSWSCCSDVNKPVLEFDQFIAIPGCSQSTHTDEAVSVTQPTPAAAAPQAAPPPVATSSGSTEVFTGKPSIVPQSTPATQEEVKEEEDDLSVKVAPGTLCRRKGCGVTFVSDDVNRIGDGEGTVCVHHPKDPIFHEGSKGYLCCKRRVLEFEEFLKITGCKTGRHVFAPKASLDVSAEQKVDCRIDHYQTLTEVHVSVFAKQAIKDRCTIGIQENEVSLDLSLPASKRFTRTIELFGPVNPQESSFKFYGTKVELILKKADSRSWTVLEKANDESLSKISFTFGVGGRTGTIGGKELVLDEGNKIGRG